MELSQIVLYRLIRPPCSLLPFPPPHAPVPFAAAVSNPEIHGSPSTRSRKPPLTAFPLSQPLPPLHHCLSHRHGNPRQFDLTFVYQLLSAFCGVCQGTAARPSMPSF